MDGGLEMAMETKKTTAEMMHEMHQSLHNLRKDITNFYHAAIDEIDNMHGALLDLEHK